MPVYPIEISLPAIQLQVWKITESVQDFALMYPDLNAPDHINHPDKILEFLASRAAFLHILPNSKLNKTPNGKPEPDHDGHLSISHTRGWAAVVFNDQSPVGIDLEIIEEKAFRLRNKFSHQDEWAPLQLMTAYQDFVLFSVIWSVKEAVYKLLPHRGWSFKDDFFVSSINPKLQTFSVRVRKNQDEICLVRGIFKFFEGIVMVVAVPDNVDKQ
jgi:4'-phosphopantetheinyl transferase